MRDWFHFFSWARNAAETLPLLNIIHDSVVSISCPNQWDLPNKDSLFPPLPAHILGKEVVSGGFSKPPRNHFLSKNEGIMTSSCLK